MMFETQKWRISLAIMLLGYCALGRGSSNKTDPGWRFPNDHAWIKSRSKPRPYRVRGLPEGTTIVDIEYRQPGFLANSPNGGYWQFERIGKIYYRKHPFALIGTRKNVWIDQGQRHYLSGLATVLIYDEDGDGFFETVVDLPIYGGPEVHIPAWALH